jgi:hypothetical protein
MNAFDSFLRKCPRSLRLVFAVHLLVLPLGASEQDVLYDVDFSGPVHVLHQPPATGTAINRVSKVVFGSPEVVPEFGPLKDRPLLFRGRAGYDQIRFEITPGWSKYRIEYDLVTSNLQNSRYSFGVSVDTPQVRNFDLHGGINKAYRFPGIMPDMLHQLWVDGKKSHYVIEVDIGLNTWNIWQDGIHLTTGPLNATEVKSVRFSLAQAYGGTPENLSVVAALDNVKITPFDRLSEAPPRGPMKPGSEALLYDVDFEEPFHQLHQPPSVGNSIRKVSSFPAITPAVTGSPEVVPEFSSLKNRPLLFSGAEGPEQIQLNLPPGWPKYRIEYDAVTENVKGSDFDFRVAVTPSAQFGALRLHGRLQKTVTGQESEVSAQLWEEGVASHFVIEVDMGEGRWSVWQDGIELANATLDSIAPMIVRIGLMPTAPTVRTDPSIGAALDNLKITGLDYYYPGPPASLSTDGKNRLDGLLVSWPSVYFADVYRLYRSETAGFDSAKLLAETRDPKHVDPTAQLDKRYFYWVTTVRDVYESGPSGSGSGTWEYVPPTILSISKGERTDGITLSWTRGTPSASYQIHRSLSRDFAESTLLATTPSLAHLDTSAEPGMKYFYWITSTGSSLPPDAPAGGYGVRGFPALEDLVVTFDPDNASFHLQWSAVSGASHYTIYRSSRGSFSNAMALGRISGLSFMDDSIAIGTDYQYWVIPGTVETKDFAFARGLEVTSHAQPDLWAQNATDDPIGKGVANQTGAGQSILMSAKSKRSLSGTVGIATLDAGSELVSLTGSAGNRHFRTTYYLNGNVTAAMSAGTLKTSASPVAQSVDVRVTPNGRNRGPSKAKSITLQIRATSLISEEASDLVILRATGKSKR